MGAGSAAEGEVGTALHEQAGEAYRRIGRARDPELRYDGHALARRDEGEHGGELVDLVADSGVKPAAWQARTVMAWQSVPGVAVIQGARACVRRTAPWSGSPDGPGASEAGAARYIASP